MLKQSKITLLLLLASFVSSQAQNIKGNVGPEFSHGANAKKGDAGDKVVNVDPYTGTGAVNIPIYDFESDGARANISLNYVTKGIRVDELASSVGLGWSLEAGGQIVRQVNGLEDEVTLPVKFVVDTNDYLQGFLAPDAILDPNQQKVDDLEADLFHVNIGGRGFSFSIKKDVNGFFQCVSNATTKIKIEPGYYDYNPSTGVETPTPLGQTNFGDSTHNILSFKVTDEFGNMYYFRRGNYQHKTYELSADHFYYNTGVYYPINTWDLTEIKTVGGQSIKYEYVRKYVEYEESRLEIFKPGEGEIDSDPYDGTPDPRVTFDPLQIKETIWKGIKTHISKITYPNDVKAIFHFVASDMRCDCIGDYRLGGITLESGPAGNTNSILYNFYQGYFLTPAYGRTATEAVSTACSTLTNNLAVPTGKNVDSAKTKYLARNHRLKLLSVNRRVGSGSNILVEPYYSFTYNATPLPERFSAQKDLYGFFNNKPVLPYVRNNYLVNIQDTFYLSIPQLTEVDPREESVTYTYGADRSHDFNAAQAFVLNKITNKNGGEILINYSDYTLTNPDSAYRRYEPIQGGGGGYNVYYDTDPELQGRTVNDGLIVGSIESKNYYDNLSSTKTVYTYSNGQRFHQGGFLFYRDKHFQRTHTNFLVAENQYYRGSNHGFSNVTVTEYGHSNEWLSATRYKFTNMVYYDEFGKHQTSLMSHMGQDRQALPVRMKTYRMGLPITVEKLDENLYTQTLTEYSFEFKSYPDSIKNCKFYTYMYFYDTAHNGYTATTVPYDYNIVENKMMRLTGQTVRSFIGNSGAEIATTTNYSYDGRNNVNRVSWNDSKGILFSKIFKYSYDYDNLYGNASLYTHQHRLSESLWKRSGTDSLLVNFTMTAPSLSSIGLGKGAKFRLKSSALLTSAQANHGSYINTTTAMAFTVYPDPTVLYYGANLNLISATTKHDSKGNGIETGSVGNNFSSYIYDIKSGDVLASVSNAKYDDIAYCSFESGSSGYAAAGTADDNKGNWDFNPSGIIFSEGAMTGKFVHRLAGSGSILRTKMLANKKYLLTFWAKVKLNGLQDNPLTYLPTVALYSSTNSLMQNISCQVANTVGDWRLFTAVVYPNNSSGGYIKISNAYPTPTVGSIEIQIDEARVHPLGATMKSYTYAPLHGVSSENNASNYIIYREYDRFGRPHITRDMRKNIVEKIDEAFQHNDLDPNTSLPGNPGDVPYNPGY